MSRKRGPEDGSPETMHVRPRGGTGFLEPNTLRPRSAPVPGPLSICPHCWHLNRNAARLCGRCGADMTMVLQESGGARRTAPVQSPVPVRGTRLSPVQRAIVLGFLALLALGQILGAFGGFDPAPDRGAPVRAPVSY